MITNTSLQITSKILQLIAEIDEFKGAWRALGLLEPDRLLALRRVASIESVGSSTRIEGSQLSDRDVEKLLSGLEIKTFDSRDQQEVAGYAEVMELVFQSFEHISMNENHLRQLHRDLLKYSEKDSYHRGQYKKLDNHVTAFDETGKQIGIVFQTASPFDTPRLMNELLVWHQQMMETKHLHPLLVIALFIVIFLEIHPFQDGNGRLSRILTTLLLLRAGYGYVIYSSLESIIEQNKEAYYLALRQTQGTIRNQAPNWQPWVLFFLQALHQQTKNLAKKIEREKLVLAALPALSVQILEYAKAHGRVTIAAMVKDSGVSRNTLKDHFQQLMAKNHLVMHGSGRGTWYGLA